MTLMWNIEKDASGQPIAGKRVTISLLSGEQPAYSDNQLSIESVGEILTDENGRWELDLEPNVDLVPAGTVYSALLRFRGGNYAHLFTTPDAPGLNWIGDNLSEIPGDLPSGALGGHLADTTAHLASAVVVSPIGGLVATNAQSALAEIDLELSQEVTNRINDVNSEEARALAAEANLAATKQPLDSDLTAIAALSTTPFGRNLLALADGAALAGSIPNGTYVQLGVANTGNVDISGVLKALGVNMVRGDAAANMYFLAMAGPTGALTQTGSNIFAAGHRAGASLTTASGFVGIGSFAGENTTDGDSVTLVGYRAGRANTSGTGFTAVGDSAAALNTTGINNTAVGDIASWSNVTGSNNTSIGYAALHNATGSFNNALGQAAGYNLATGSYNVAVGYAALEGGTGANAGSGNVGIGHAAGGRAKGYYNIILGYQAGYNNAADLTGDYNVIIGASAANLITSASNNVFLGNAAGNNALQKNDATNSIAIGTSAYTTADNQVVLGHTTITETLLRGKVGIGTTSPQSLLHLVSAAAPLRLERTGIGFFTQGLTANNAGSVADLILEAGQSSSGFIFRPTNAGGVQPVGLTIDRNGNIGVGTSSQYGGGVGAVGIANATTAPTTNPTGGGVLYAEGGALKWRGSSGTVTTLAVA